MEESVWRSADRLRALEFMTTMTGHRGISRQAWARALAESLCLIHKMEAKGEEDRVGF